MNWRPPLPVHYFFILNVNFIPFCYNIVNYLKEDLKMVDIPMKSSGSYSSQTITSINSQKKRSAVSCHNILDVNKRVTNSTECLSRINTETSPIESSSINEVYSPSIPHLPMPSLQNKVQKGQKVNLFSNIPAPYIDVFLGWNVKNQNCDVDVSAFLLGKDGKVLGDSWFVFYGQTSSPDNSVTFNLCNNNTNREMIHINLNNLNKEVDKIVFVLTLNEALEKNLNFEMIEDAYIRIIDNNNRELTSFLMTDYYSNVISMMIGEIYLHNGNWKFNAIGNGVRRDLAGLCELYGVQVI